MSPNSSNVGAVLVAFAAGSLIGWFWPGASPARSVGAKVSREEPKPHPEATQATGQRGNEGGFNERLANVLEIRNGMKRTRAIAAIAEGLNSQQIREALDAIQRTHTPERKSIASSLLTRWVEIEPETAFEYALQMEPELYCVDEVITRWVNRDEAAARAAIERLPGGENRHRRAALGGLVEALGEIDPARALAELQKNKFFGYSVESVFEKWASRDPHMAASQAANLSKQSGRRDAYRAIAKAWATIDLQAALQWAETLTDRDVDGYMGNSSPLAVVVTEWMDRDPEGTLQWLEQRHAASQSHRLLESLSLEAIFKIGDPLLSAKLVAMLPQNELQTTAWRNLMSWWGDNDLAGALDWANSQTKQVQRAVLPTLASKLAESDPAEAMELVTGCGSLDTHGVMLAWAYRDPASAAEWIASQPPNAEHLETVALCWVQKDVIKATEWINGIEDGDDKDQAIGKVVELIQGTYPEVASAWIAGIHDVKKRNEAYGDLASLWFIFDPVAARKWLGTAPLPDEMRSKILAAESR